MRYSILAIFVASQVLAALVCEPYVPTDTGWSFNLASGYLTANKAARASMVRCDVSNFSPFGVDGYGYGTSYIFTLLNCTDKDLGVQSYATSQCYPTFSKGQNTNTTTRTDFIRIQSDNNSCLTVVHPNKHQSDLIYKACDPSPHDLRQLFKAVRTLSYNPGTCSGDPSRKDLSAVRVLWEESAGCREAHHWHLKNDTDIHSEILLKKSEASDERFVFFDEAG